MNRFEVSVERHFSAAHALRNYRGKCERLHGHNWRVRLAASGRRLSNGLLVDFNDLKKLLGEILEPLDHRFLNDEVERFRNTNPTTEEIARYLAVEAAARLPAHLRLAWVEVEEAPGSRARFIPGR